MSDTDLLFSSSEDDWPIQTSCSSDDNDDVVEAIIKNKGKSLLDKFYESKKDHAAGSEWIME